jgi:hypothetical protein
MSFSPVCDNSQYIELVSSIIVVAKDQGVVLSISFAWSATLRVIMIVALPLHKSKIKHIFW